MATTALIGLGIIAARERANKPEIKRLQLSDYNSRAPSEISRLRISIHPAALFLLNDQ